MVGACVYKGGEEDVSEAVYGEVVKVTVSKIEFEPASEVFDSACELISVEGGKRRGGVLEIFS